jgi:osmotically-inducible protein OsmY
VCVDAQTASKQRIKVAARSRLRNNTMKNASPSLQVVSAEPQRGPSVRAARIGVDVKDGRVSLAGRVNSSSKKWTARHAALPAPGVKDTASELPVYLSSLTRRTDADIEASAKNVLDWVSSVPAGAIRVMVEGGWVTLSGEVDRHCQRQAVSGIVRNLLGVRGVRNQIGIKPSMSATAVRSHIEAALKRTPIADAEKIFVAMQGSDVTLSGTVHSWTERDTATNFVWGAPGVHNVVDMLTLA